MRPLPSLSLFFILFLGALTIAPSRASAATIELPLFLRTQVLQNALLEFFAPPKNRPIVLFQEGDHNYLHISAPQITIRNGEPYFSCNANAGMGFDSLGILPSTVKWNGSIIMRLSFFVDSQWQLRYHILDSAIYNEKGGKPVVTGFAWELCKRFLHPRLEQFHFDLAMPQQEISAILRASAAPEKIAPLNTALKTLRIGTLRVNNDGLVAPLLLTVTEDQTKPVPLPPQPPLGFEEMEKLQRTLEPLDAFLVFIVKKLSADLGPSLHEEQLFDLLITSRYQLLTILTGPTPTDTGDPLRALFVEIWEQLRPIIESSTEKNGLMQKQLLRYMSFMNAGDALLVVDRAAPGLGIHITTDGLRRMVRMLEPVSGGASKEDPLKFDWQTDQDLQKALQWQSVPELPAEALPLPVPEAPAAPATDALPAPPSPPLDSDPVEKMPPVEIPSSAAPPEQHVPEATLESIRETIHETFPTPAPPLPAQPGQIHLPEQPDVPRSPAPENKKKTVESGHTNAIMQRWRNFFITTAHAETMPTNLAPELREKLKFWVPSSEEFPEYSRIIGHLLNASAKQQSAQNSLAPKFATIFQHLLPATAMIESCWRQYEQKGDKVIALRSEAGGIGIMQINQHVWRGLYDMERLQGDVAYNIQAGSQILMRYFKQHAIKIAEETNTPSHAARAAYAAYNAGPRAARRFLRQDANVRQKRVDEHLWDLYRKSAAGGKAVIADCTIQ